MVAQPRRPGESSGTADRGCGWSRLAHPVEANELFLDLGTSNKAALRAQGFGFYDWGPAAGPVARLVVSWDQSQDSVDALCKALRAVPVV